MKKKKYIRFRLNLKDRWHSNFQLVSFDNQKKIELGAFGDELTQRDDDVTDIEMLHITMPNSQPPIETA